MSRILIAIVLAALLAGCVGPAAISERITGSGTPVSRSYNATILSTA